MHFIETGISNEILLVLYFCLNFGVLLYLEYKRKFSLLRKTLLMSILISLVFSGNILHVFGLNVNIGVMFISLYYFTLFLFMRIFSIEECFDLLKDIFSTFIIIWILTAPLAFFNFSHTLYYLHNLIDDILIDRLNYFVIILIAFYLGVMLYLHSFKVIAYKGVSTFKKFLFEYVVRIQTCMLIQSSIFYYLVILSQGILTSNVLLPALVYNISQGAIARFILFTLSSGIVYYILKLSDKKYKTENIGRTKNTH